jgi:hypothetical protein
LDLVVAFISFTGSLANPLPACTQCTNEAKISPPYAMAVENLTALIKDNKGLRTYYNV